MPDTWAASRGHAFDAVLELPLGDLFDDAAAMYRARDHGLPVVNGTSGFEPTHYFTLKTALNEHDPAALDGFPPGRRILIVVDKQKDANREWRGYLDRLPNVTPVADEERWGFFAADLPPPAPICSGEAIAIASIATDGPPVDRNALTDGRADTWWATAHAQRPGDALQFDFGGPAHPCAVLLSVGEFRASYPRKLAIETSSTGRDWTTVAVTRTAGLTMRAALENPKSVSIAIPLAASEGRFLRLRIDEPHPKVAWMVTDVAVIAGAAPE